MNESPSPPSGEALQSLLSHPDLIQRVREILSSPSDPPMAEAPIEKNAPPEPSSPSPPPIDGLSRLLSDPTLLEKLPGILTTVKPLLSALPAMAAPPASGEEPKSLPACRDHLLLSLKPFLSPARRDAVDTILRIARLGEVLGQLK